MNPSPASRNLPLAELALSLVILLFAWLSPRFVPYNMDEFSHYHVLGCKQAPLTDAYPEFSEACGEYDLKPPGFSDYLPLRSYIYIGVLQTAPFMVFWKMIKDPVAGRMQGAVFLILATYLLARLTGARWAHVQLAVLLFPTIVAPYILDTGTVGLLMCNLLAVFLLIRRALLEPRRARKTWLGIAVGVLVFLGLSVKPVLVWAAPAIALWALWVLRPVREGEWDFAGYGRDYWLTQWRSQWPLIAAALVACVLPLLWLFSSLDRKGERYFAVAASGGTTLWPTDVLWQAFYLGRLLFSSAMFEWRVLEIDNNALDMIPALLGIAMVALAWRTQARARRAFVLLLFGMALVTFAFICTNRTAWSPHHVAFAFVFLMGIVGLAIAEVARRKVLFAALMAIGIGYWTSLYLRLPAAYVHPDTNFDKDRLSAFIREQKLDADTVQVHADWGTYYLNMTFGDSRQLCLFVYEFARLKPADKRRAAERLREIAHTEKRDILLVSRVASDLYADATVRSAFGAPAQVWPFGTWTLARYRF